MKTTTIQKWGNSLAVRIPKEVVQKANFRENESVDIAVTGGKITLKGKTSSHAIPKYSLRELVKGITPRNRNIDRAWLNLKPTGKEVW